MRFLGIFLAEKALFISIFSSKIAGYAVMKEFEPLLIENVEIRIGKTRIHRLALHRHLASVDQVGDHAHEFDQCLLYLRGSGAQRLEGQKIGVERGSLVCIRRGTSHGFEKARERSPLCLALNWTTPLAKEWEPFRTVPERHLGRIEQSLHELATTHLRREISEWLAGEYLLRIGGIFASVIASQALAKEPRIALEKAVLAALEKLTAAEWSPSRVAALLGRSVDSINRELPSPGLTLGGIISQRRLAIAREELLRSNRGVGEVAEAAGFDDQNYFARWFRRHTGQSPTQWRRSGG